MPGTLVQDALAYTLIDETVTASTTEAGVDVQKPAEVSVELVTGAITGTGVTVDVEVEGSDLSDFSAGVVSYGRFAGITETNDSETRYLQARAYKQFMRVDVTVAGTSPSAPLTVKVRTPHDRRTPDRTA